jgi:hypothetical protein
MMAQFFKKSFSSKINSSKKEFSEKRESKGI